MSTVTKIPAIPSNYSDEEVLRHFQHYFPNPGNNLKTLLDRFDKLIDQAEAGEGYKNDYEHLTENWSAPCPECGTAVRVDLNEEEEHW